MFRQHQRHIRGATALALALGLSAAQVAWARPQPPTKAGAVIAATNGHHNPVVRPNPDEQIPWDRTKPPVIVRQHNPVVRPNPDEQVAWDRTQSPMIVRVVVPGGGCRSHTRVRHAIQTN
jgi:hypothetical protein